MNAHNSIMLPNEAQVRRFFEIYHENARTALHGLSDPGVLQLVRLRPDDREPTIVVGRFPIGAIDAMTAAAMAEASGGCNVYVEGRTVRSDLRGNKRGSLADTRGVFALVADADADKYRDANLGGIEPTMSVESSPGNRHDWLFLSKAVAADEAQKLGAAFRAVVGGDDDTGNPTQPYRVAGTPNFPGPKKQARGRTVSATSVLTEGRGYSVQDLKAAFSSFAEDAEATPSAKPTSSHLRPIEDLLVTLPTKRRLDLEEIGLLDRSAHFMKVTGWLKGDGYSQEEAVALWREFPAGAGVAKYGPRLAQEVGRIWSKATDDPDAGAVGAAFAERLKAGRAIGKNDARPVDLWAKFDPPELPRDVLPLVIEEFARVEGGMMGADPGGLAAAALAVCAAAIPDKIKLQVKQHDDSWTESARLWVALIGTPSTKKSPILSQAVKPLAKIDARLWRAYSEAMALYERLPKEEKHVTKPPKQVRLRIEDTTIEAAQEVLKDSPDGLLCLQDELSGWFGAIDKYSGGRGAAKDRSFWLQSFNGGAYSLNRIGRGSSFIENLSISMLGGIQPEPLRKLSSDSVDDGLLQRLFPIVLRPATIGMDEKVPDAVGRYGAMVERLHQLREPVLGGAGNLSGVLATVLRFDEDAQVVRRELEVRHHELMASEAINKKLAAHIGKYDGLFARLCVLWHCVEHADEARLPVLVSGETASRAAAFLHSFLLPHAVAFYAGMLGLSDDHDRLAAVAGYILAHKLERVTNRDVQRGDRTMRSIAKQDIQRLFEQLDALGWLEQVSASRPSDAPHWIVNPECHRLFEERAVTERKRRADARELIAELTRSAA